MKKIPLNSLVILVKPIGAKLPEKTLEKFSDYEIISIENIRYELTGDASRLEINKDVYNEAYRRAELKLRLGERVVIVSTNIKKHERNYFTQLSKKYNIPVFYIVYNSSLKEKINNSYLDSSLIQRYHQLFNNFEWEILRGDNKAEVIDLRYRNFEVVKKPNNNDTLSDLIEKFNGITVIGDIHGSIEGMKSSVNWARSRKNLIVFLGDLIDYGPNSLECIDLAYDILMRGEGVSILGNHEIKIEKYIRLYQKNEHHDMNINSGNKATLNLLEELPQKQKEQWMHKFLTVTTHSRNHWIAKNIVISHAGVLPEMFDMNVRRLPYKSEISRFSTYGGNNLLVEKDENGKAIRDYTWVNSIPKNKTAIVGHSIRDYYQPKIIYNNNGGTTIFLDTGSGKGGTLSSCDIKYTQESFKITNFNKH